MTDTRPDNEELESRLADQEALISSITANVPGVVYQFYARGDEWGMHFVSEKAQDIFGISYNPKTFVQDFVAQLPGDEADRFMASIVDVVKRVVPWSFEGRFIRPDGKELYFRGDSTPTVKKDELIFHGLLLDITDQRKAEEEKEEQAQIIQAITANMPGVVYEFTVDGDGNGHTTYVSERSAEIFGIPAQPEKFIERFRECIPEKEREGFSTSVRLAVEAGDPWYYEGAFLHPNGETMHFHGASVPSERRGKLVYHGILVDQTDQERIQEEVRHNQRLESIGQLAGGVAHDFNNMLGGIMGAAELLVERNRDDPEAANLARLIMDTATRAGELTWQLLAFSRKAVNVRKPQLLHELIHRTCTMLERSIDRRITIECTLEAERDTVLGDPAQLQAAFLNLSVNARDAMPNGGTLHFESQLLSLKKKTSVSGRQLKAGDYLQLRVRDTGGGIPESVRPRIFEPFFTTKPIGQGTGMGLAAVYGTIAEHGGNVSLLDSSSEGTCFEILLPLTDQEEKEEVDSSHVPLAKATQRVLLIDDEKIVRHTARRLIESLGYSVEEAGDGEEGVERFRQEADQFDVIVLDMIMPKLNGEDAFAQLRNIRRDIPIVLCSGYSLDESVARLRKQGLAGHLTKPFRRKQLGEALLQAIAAGE